MNLHMFCRAAMKVKGEKEENLICPKVRAEGNEHVSGGLSDECH